MTDKWWNWKDFEGSGFDPIEVILQYLPGETEVNHENSQKAGVQDEVRDQHIWNPGLELCLQTKLFGLSHTALYDIVWTEARLGIMRDEVVHKRRAKRTAKWGALYFVITSKYRILEIVCTSVFSKRLQIQTWSSLKIAKQRKLCFRFYH
jgi:hypothetical protein